MSYTWITPKTDWTTTTRFEYTDYNRIRNNLLYINDMLNELYPDKAQTLDLGDAKTGYSNNYAVSEFTAFEDALESFTRIGRDVNVGDRNYYRGNDSFIWADALNRLEECCVRWKDEFSLPYVEIQLPYDMRNGGTAVVKTPVEAIGRKKRLYIMGGYNGTSECWSYDDENNTFRRELDLPINFALSIQAISDDNLTYGGSSVFDIVGGTNENLTSPAQNKIYCHNINNEWSVYDVLPIGLLGTAPVFNENDEYYYLIGGINQFLHPTDDDYLFFYTIKRRYPTSITRTTLPMKVIDGSAQWFNNGIYLISSHNETNNKLYYWDTNTWSEICDLPHKNSGGKLVVSHNSLYYFGGEDLNDQHNYYKFDGNKFKKVGTIGRQFIYGACVDYKGSVYVIAGSNSSSMYKITKY